MKKTRKIISLLLAVLMIVGIMCGCGGNNTVKEKGKYTYWVTFSPEVAQTNSSFNDLLMYQELEKRTGVHVDFIHPSNGASGTEAFQILLTSADMPDMVEYKWSAYPGGAEKAVQDKVIISLNKYMEEYAPNYYSYMEGEKSKENPLYKVQTVTQAGNYYGFKNLNIGTLRNFGGFIIRKDLLDKWGLEIPVTIDDWTEVFKTAKENGIKKPLTGDEGLFSIRGSELFNVAWGVGKNWYVEGNEVKYGLEQPGYKEYVRKMAEWFKAGYIDPDYLTNETDVLQGNMTNGTSIVVYGSVGATMGKLLSAMEERDPNYNLAACPYPVLKEGDTPYMHDVAAESLQPTIAITYNCGKDDENRYKEAIKWCDYLYSDDGIILKAFGVEGVTYKVTTKEDGSKKYEYLITTPEEQEKVGAHSVEAALYHYMRPANSPGFNQHPDYLDGYYPYQQQKDAIVLWNTHVEEAKKHTLPTLTYTDEEATKRADINSRCRDKLDAAVSKIITNEASIDTFDTAVEEAMKNGFEEFKQITQTAYDRYLKAMK